MTRVAVLGADGRMGSTSVAAIEATDDLEVVARVDVVQMVTVEAGVIMGVYVTAQ